MESSLLRAGAASLVAAWAVVLLVVLTGHLVWSNKLLWLPVALFSASFLLALGSWEYEEKRAPLVLVAALAFGSLLIYAVGYVFLFALVGH
jgi:hypothetical protein